MEGTRKLTEYDIFQKAGGALRTVKESFLIEVNDGVLNLFFSKGSADLASIKAIELTRHTPGARVAVAPAATSLVRLFPNPVGTTLIVQLSFPVREMKATAIRDARGSKFVKEWLSWYSRM
jgi:large repetitive protein